MLLTFSVLFSANQFWLGNEFATKTRSMSGSGLSEIKLVYKYRSAIDAVVYHAVVECIAARSLDYVKVAIVNEPTAQCVEHLFTSEPEYGVHCCQRP